MGKALVMQTQKPGSNCQDPQEHWVWQHKSGNGRTGLMESGRRFSGQPVWPKWEHQGQ